MTLLPENANKRIDNLGRITLPKGLRSRLYLETGTEMELYTMIVAGKHYICLTNMLKFKKYKMYLNTVQMFFDRYFEGDISTSFKVQNALKGACFSSPALPSSFPFFLLK